MEIGNAIIFKPQGISSPLIGEWLFSGNANDSSGYSNNGVVTGATLVNDRFGNPNSAYSFDGNDIITISNYAPIRGLSKCTFEYWVYKASGNDVLCGYFYSSNIGIWLQWYTNNEIYFSVRNLSSNYVAVPCNLFNQWVKIKGVFDGTQVNNDRCKIYVNDVLQSVTVSGTQPTVITELNANLTFGGVSGIQSVGIIDDIRIYNDVI